MDMADANRISGQLRVKREEGDLDLYYRFMDQNDWTLLLSHTEDEFTYSPVTPCARIALEAGYSITLYPPYTDTNAVSTTDPNRYDPNNYGYGYVDPYPPYYPNPNNVNLPMSKGK